MTPLLCDNIVEADYLLLEQALEENAIEISEVSDGGSVSDIKVQNKSARRILLLDGEELVGAKQNRILNVSVMVPAEKTITIPVSCVEAGRWNHRTSNFSSANRAHFAEGRARKTRRVNESMRSYGSRRGSQGEVWADISLKSVQMCVSSDTDASEALYAEHRVGLDEYLSAFSTLPNQKGAVFSIDGATSGVDLFDSNHALAGSFNKLVESYALDAIDLRGRDVSDKSSTDVDHLLQELSNASFETYPAVGEGEDCRFDGSNLSGGALLVDDRVVHLCAFQLADSENVRVHRHRMARASARHHNRRV